MPVCKDFRFKWIHKNPDINYGFYESMNFFYFK